MGKKQKLLIPDKHLSSSTLRPMQRNFFFLLEPELCYALAKLFNILIISLFLLFEQNVMT